MGNRFLFTTKSRTLAFGDKQYGWPTLAIAGLLVMLISLLAVRRPCCAIGHLRHPNHDLD